MHIYLYRVSTIRLHTLNVNTICGFKREELKTYYQKEQRISIFSPKVLGDNCIIYASLSYFDKGPLFAFFYDNFMLFVLGNSYLKAIKKIQVFFFLKMFTLKKVIIISFFIQSQSLFTLILDPVIQVVKIGIFKIMRHKLCNCLPKLLAKKYLFFVLSNNMSKVLLS